MKPDYRAVTRETLLLKIDHVSLTIGERPILRDVCAEVRDVRRPGKEQGQVVGFLGPSGVGKTMLFRVIAGLEERITGRVLVKDGTVPVKAGMVGVVSQSYPLFKHRRVGENLMLAGRQSGMQAAEARDKARDLLERLQLVDRWNDWPGELSGGQRQRVAIIQQLLCSAHYLLMDEPFSGLDPNMKDETCRLIAEIAAFDEYLTIIVITHDIASAAAISDTLWLIGRERDQQGKPIPGSRIQAEYDLVGRNLAWQEQIEHLPEFVHLVQEVRERFRTL